MPSASLRGLIASRPAAALVAALLLAATAGAQTPPPGFTDTQVVPPGGAGGAQVPTTIAYEPGAGHLWVCEKGPGTASGSARVRRRDAGTGMVTTALTLTVDSTGERGILGLAFDPDFTDVSGTSRLVYVYYTTPTPSPHNRVSRFTESGGTLSTEEIILEGPTLNAATNHNGGCLRFRSDETLFVSMGDNDTDGDANPLSRDLSDLRGKILRINRDGTIPPDNPFVGDPGVREEIYEYGHRNPWRFHFDPDNDAMYVADVGESCFENVFLGLPGADYGYPCFEGIRPFRACSGTLPPGSVTFPIYWYGHSATGPCATPPVQGGSITGGPVYRGTAFPAQYRDSYYFADYSGHWIRRAKIAGDGTLTDVETFVPSGTNGPVDLAISPAGCLAYASINGLGVHEICYVGGTNQQPEAVASAVPVAGLAPLDVQFTGSSSSDPDMDPLTFAWDFGDTGSDTIPDPLHQYTINGVYSAVLTVNDGRGAPNSADTAPSLRIVVGNRPPVAVISMPADGSPYDAGQTINFAGSATDPEDGALPATSLEWTVVFHHGTHQHPFLGPVQDVSSGSFVVPDTGEEATNVFYRIWLSATDSGAPIGSTATLEAKTYVDIVPNVTTTTLVTDPAVPGLQLGWDGTVADAPHSHVSVAGFRRRVTAPTPQVVGGDTWEFVSWSDGGAADHVIGAPSTDSTLTAVYACTGGTGCTEAGRCTGGVDDDFDGDVDCDDSDCGTDPACSETGNCADGVDNDADGDVDCADSECVGTGPCLEQGNCGDGVDNDGDGFTDCDDVQCTGDRWCIETGFCRNGVDDEGDGLTDCEDPDCAADPYCDETGNCTDGVDNDLDGDRDCADSECATDAGCCSCPAGAIDQPAPTTTCRQVMGTLSATCRSRFYRFDLLAGQCYEFTTCPALCGAAGFDSIITVHDPLCTPLASSDDAPGCGAQSDLVWAPETPGIYLVEVTGFGAGLGAFTLGYFECSYEAAVLHNCADGVDNDVDGSTDCTDSDCSGDPACMEAGNCADGIDNDLDGLTDCADIECRPDAACVEAGQCADGVDNDADRFVDCEDSECFLDPGCASVDSDGDTVVNMSDCAPFDAPAYAFPVEVSRLDVVRDPALGIQGVHVTWTDQALLSGSGTTYDVAIALLSTLARPVGADAPCAVTGLVVPSHDEASILTHDGFYYLVRAVNACGLGPWGLDSLGVPQPACP